MDINSRQIDPNRSDMLYPDYSEQYRVTLEFQLQRQKQKNKILEERLRNKQIFIVQIKEMHSELQILSEQCRNQLNHERMLRQDLQTRKLRQYVQKIAELEHQIGTFKNRSKNESEPFRKHRSKNHTVLTDSKQKQSKNNKKKLPFFGRQQLFSSPKVESKEIINRQSKFQQNNQITEKFVDYFLSMSELYLTDIADLSLKKKLKESWRWIKDVVKCWDQLTQKQQNFMDFITSLQQTLSLSVDCTLDQILSAIEKLKQNQIEN